ncbi:hypothetical protein [Sphingomonas sp. NFR04]|uniref:hypothetical protein n=1 Tax=Sphingomonas sp. NFR04 TaxID=1566283 RepID=UPI0015874247|nr:hypothetical protein [Sphingomonas sp. NFR04]
MIMAGALGAPAWAQDAPAADPTPQAIPGVLQERFRLPGTPAPSPTPSPSPTSSPLVRPVIVPLATPRPRPSPTAAPSPAPTPSSSPQPTATAPAPAPPDQRPAAPLAAPTPQESAGPVQDRSGWLWLVLGAIGVAGLAGAGWWHRSRDRRLAAPSVALAASEPERPLAAPEPPPLPAPPLLLPPGDGGEPLAIHIVAATVAFLAETVAFDLEIDVINAQDRAAEGLRPALALISASPDQDRWRSAFHAGPPAQNQGGPVDLAPGGRLRLPARLTLRRDQLHVVTHGGRPMFVAMLLCDLRWRGGLSLHRAGADFLLGTAGQGPRPGPIWLDRAAPPALSATRYVPPQP